MGLCKILKDYKTVFGVTVGALAFSAGLYFCSSAIQDRVNNQSNNQNQVELSKELFGHPDYYRSDIEKLVNSGKPLDAIKDIIFLKNHDGDYIFKRYDVMDIVKENHNLKDITKIALLKDKNGENIYDSSSITHFLKDNKPLDRVIEISNFWIEQGETPLAYVVGLLAKSDIPFDTIKTIINLTNHKGDYVFSMFDICDIIEKNCNFEPVIKAASFKNKEGKNFYSGEQMRIFIHYTVPLLNEEEKYAVLLIDMQQDFLGKIDKEEQEDEIPNQIEILQYAQRNNFPIVVLEYEGNDKTIKRLRQVLSNSDYETITKPRDDGFDHTNLNGFLKERNISALILIGINASACVKATAEGALKRGYKIITSPDIIAEPRSLGCNESVSWFESIGYLFNNHSELIYYFNSKMKK